MAQSLTPAEYAQLQQLINRMQSDRSPPATSQHPVILRPPTPRPPTPHPLHPTLLPPAPSAPISHSYQSFRTQAPQEYPTISDGHSALPSLPTLQPFLGFSSLGTSLIGQVNQQRLASSAATQPRQPQLPLRGWRRGPAIRPPQLPRAPRLEDCVSHITGEPLVQLAVKVYPPQRTWSENLFHYRYLRDSFTAWLEEMDLYYTFNLPPSTPVVSLIEQVALQMENSNSTFSFASTPHDHSFLQNETLPLQLLEFANRGIPRPSDMQIQLRRMALPTDTTINDLLTDRTRFAVNRLAIEGSNRFLVNLVVQVYPLTAMTAFKSGDVARPHTCLSVKTYFRFARDHADGSGSQIDVPSSNGEDDTEDETDVRHLPRSSQGPSRVVRFVTPLSPSAPIPHTSVPTANSSGSTSITPTTRLRSDGSFPSLSSLPPKIWGSSWVPSPGCYMGQLSSIRPRAEQAYGLAADDNRGDGLHLTGQSITALAAGFKTLLGDAAERGDFTDILHPNRSFVIENEAGETISLGDGVEREVVQTVFGDFKKAGSEWFIPHANGFSTLATSHCLTSSRFVSLGRKRNMSILGAITALSLVRGMSASPFDPVLLHFFVHNCDLHSIHPGILGEWHPILKRTVTDWINMGPGGDATPFQPHFATFRDTQIACLRDQNQESHDALASEMIYHAIIGTEPAAHPEIQSFLKGFLMPCRNGFTFAEFAKSWDGGSEAFLSSSSTSQILCYTSMESHVDIRAPAENYTYDLRGRTGDPSLTFKALLVDFLKGMSIPCPGLFTQARVHFNRVDVDTIDKEYYRCRVFCCAATDSYDLESGDTMISVEWVDDHATLYSSGSGVPGHVLAAQGKINFRTCFQRALLPVSYVLGLASATYPAPGGEPKTFREAVDHWLLSEFLGAIGGHSIL